MKPIKVMCAALALALCLAGCEIGKDATVAATYQDGSIPAGVYINNLISGYYSAMDKTGYLADDVLDQTIEDMPADDWIEDYALDATRRYAAVESEFARLGLSIPDDDLSELEAEVDTIWASQGELYEQNGISQQSLELSVVNAYKRGMVMETIYGEGGDRALESNALTDLYNDTYRRIKFLSIPYTDDNGEDLDASQLSINQYYVEHYTERLEAGESFNTIIAEYSAMTQEADDNGEINVNESDHTAIISRDDVSYGYSQEFIDQLFASSTTGEVGRYNFGDYETIYQYEDLMGDGEHFESVKLTLLNDLVGDEFNELLESVSAELGCAINDSATKRYTPDKLTLS